MSANYSHLLPSAIEALDLPKSLRIRDILERRFITHERINDVFKYADYLMFRPVRPRAAGIATPAASGSRLGPGSGWLAAPTWQLTIMFWRHGIRQRGKRP